MTIFTIGFTKKSAKVFFEKLQQAHVKRIVDVRLNNVSQLAGFAKRDDLKYFLKALCKIDYVHIPELAPTKDILDEYKKNKGAWSVYERDFFALMESRNIVRKADTLISDGDCLLCSEERPDYCHRRLIGEYLKKKWKDISLEHLI